ncbi:hypothetical protein [Mycoplasmopsis columbina]|uniref:hypothetical protein n=1 Tax=Mycoplasmopsis columbina TaxID=114881 RepID=UPI0004A71109|nr:hypothetical protein [Mycoplasmopsis columbina]VEU77111.1 Uncharacterised protein [Mycoplasmopsis columbina]
MKKFKLYGLLGATALPVSFVAVSCSQPTDEEKKNYVIEFAKKVEAQTESLINEDSKDEGVISSIPLGEILKFEDIANLTYSEMNKKYQEAYEKFQSAKALLALQITTVKTFLDNNTFPQLSLLKPTLEKPLNLLDKILNKNILTNDLYQSIENLENNGIFDILKDAANIKKTIEEITKATGSGGFAFGQ